MAAASDDRIIEYARFEFREFRWLCEYEYEMCIAEGCGADLRLEQTGRGKVVGVCCNKKCKVKVLDWYKGLWQLPGHLRALNCRLCGEWLEDKHSMLSFLKVMDHMEEKHTIEKRQIFPAVRNGPGGKECKQCPVCKGEIWGENGYVECNNRMCPAKQNEFDRFHLVPYRESSVVRVVGKITGVICQFCGDCIEDEVEELYDHILHEHTFEGLKIAAGKRVRMIRPKEIHLASFNSKQTGRLTKAAAPT